MSIVTYNGITLPYALTNRFKQETVRDDGGTDWMLTKFDIEVTCHITSEYLAQLAPSLITANGPATDNAAMIMSVVRSRLLEHRKTLSMTFAGNELIPRVVLGVTGAVDARNGPVPQACDVTQLNNVNFLVRFHIIAHYWEKPSITVSAGPPPEVEVFNLRGNTVLSNRWSERVDIDELQLTTLTREGKFIIRSDNSDGFTADRLRPFMANLSIPRGFLRTSKRFMVQPDGLAIQYTVVDKEQFKMPPKPAYKAEGYYSEELSKALSIRHGEVQVRLWGDAARSRLLPGAGQADLVRAAIAVGMNKITRNGRLAVPESASLKVGLYENTVEFRFRGMFRPTVRNPRTGARGRVLGLAGYALGLLTDTPGSDGVEYTPVERLTGTAGVVLQAAAYYDPSLTTLVVDAASRQLSEGLQPGEAGRFA